MKQLLLQAFNLIRQNPFYATISIIGTAVTIAFEEFYKLKYCSTVVYMVPRA